MRVLQRQSVHDLALEINCAYMDQFSLVNAWAVKHYQLYFYYNPPIYTIVYHDNP